jgi:hypothetical protein
VASLSHWLLLKIRKSFEKKSRLKKKTGALLDNLSNPEFFPK